QNLKHNLCAKGMPQRVKFRGPNFKGQISRVKFRGPNFEGRIPRFDFYTSFLEFHKIFEFYIRMDNLKHFANYGFLACTKCRHGVPPENLDSHLSVHGLKKKMRNEIISKVSSNLRNPRDVSLPEYGVAEFPELQDAVPGFYCLKCKYTTESEQQITLHCKPWKPCAGVQHQNVFVQHIFKRVNNKKHFVVTPNKSKEGPQQGRQGDYDHSVIESFQEISPDRTSALCVDLASSAGPGELEQGSIGHDASSIEPLYADSPRSISRGPGLPFSGKKDQVTGIITYEPTNDEFRDFGKFMEKIIEVSERDTDHPGVSHVKVPWQGQVIRYSSIAFVRKSKDKVRCDFQSRENVLERTDGGVFVISNKRKDIFTAQWEKERTTATNNNGEFIDEKTMVALLNEGKYRTVYMNGIDAEKILRSLNMDQVGLSHLTGNELTGAGIKGMSTTYLHNGALGSITPLHVEDFNTESRNYMINGPGKWWLVINPKDQSKLEDALGDVLGVTSRSCDQFIRHKNLFVTPQYLDGIGIRYCTFSHFPQYMVIVHRGAYHQIFNQGNTTAISDNFARPDVNYCVWPGGVSSKEYIPCRLDTCGEGNLVLTHPIRPVGEVNETTRKRSAPDDSTSSRRRKRVWG
ncbi:hypothetical protein GP486_003223, partial [Trichoglossum hirsutum]